MTRANLYNRLCLAIVAVMGVDSICLGDNAESPVAFQRIQLSPEFVAEGAAAGDVNGDGIVDLVAGPYWYEGPDYAARHAYYPPQTFDVNAYSDNFVAQVLDLNGDDRADIFVVGFPGAEASWYENPGQGGGHWTRRTAFPAVDNESPQLADVTGDGRSELVLNSAGRLGYAEPDPRDPTRPWAFRPITPNRGYPQFNHGLGVGDVNGDGRADILEKGGWWEQPAEWDGNTAWDFHEFQFTDRGGAQMYVDDVDGDGDNDVITSLNAHGYGLAWFEQTVAEGESLFVRHDIMGEAPEEHSHGVAFSQLHAIELADVDGDGLRDIITGKRFWAHTGHDPGARDPAVLYWFQAVRDNEGVQFVPRLIDQNSGVGTQFVATDVNGDELVDVLVSNKKGTFLHKQTPRAEAAEAAPATDATAADAAAPAEASAAAEPRPDDYPFAGLTAEKAVRAMKLPPGFRARVFASEPDVKQPIAMALDDRGRVWIAEAYEYPRRAPEGQGRDRILIFADNDGDGRFDERKVFAEGLNLVSGLEVGFGGVWVGAAPYLLFIPDRNGDDVPDAEPEVLLDGWGYQDTHETLNAFIWGPDGWLYGCHGVFTHSLVGPPGTPESDRVPLNAAIWRYHPVRRQFEVFAHGTSNPWGVDFTDYGQAVCTACVIPHLFHVIQGARYHRQAGPHFNPYTYDDIKTIADHLHYQGATPHAGNGNSDDAGGGHAHAGAMIYLGDAWPQQYRGAVFMNNIHGQRLNLDLLEPRGSGLVGRHGPDFLLTQDRASQMLNFRYGPDGQALVIDWYDMQACHHWDAEVHDRSNGRIYRIEFGDAEPAAVDLARLDDDALAEMVLRRNDWYVRHARRLLQERAAAGDVAPTATAQLRELASEHADATRRLRAAWALHVIGALDDALIDGMLGDENPHVRAWAIRLATDRTNFDSAAWLSQWTEMAAADRSPVVRLQLASTAGRLPSADRWELLDALLAHAEDAADHNLPLMYWYAAEPLAAVDPPRALELALRHAHSMPRVWEFMVRRVGGIDSADAHTALLNVADSDAELDIRVAVLRGLRESLEGRSGVPAPPGWSEFYERASTADAVLQREATRLGILLHHEPALSAARAAVQSQAESQELRASYIDALAQSGDWHVVPLLYQLLADPQLRTAALAALRRFDDPQTPQKILAVYVQLSPAERREALATLASRPASCLPLLDAIAAGRVPRTDLTADLAAQIANLGDERIADRLVEVWGRVRATPDEKLALIAKYREMVATAPAEAADPVLGRAVFTRTCQACHTLFGAGAQIGPDLTGSNRADLDYLLSNIVDPAAVVTKEYQTTVIVLDDGRVVSGIVTAEDDHSVTLQSAEEQLAVAKDAIESRVQSDLSLMPENQLQLFSPEEIVSLIAYLRGSQQQPLLADPANPPPLFNGTDLTGWRGDQQLWSVENGEIVGRTSTGIPRNSFLASEIAAEDFELSLEVLLVDNAGNSGIQFRSRAMPDGDVAGYQADIGVDWWGKLYEEHGRALLWDRSGEAHVRPGEWNRYVIRAQGSRIRTWINGQPCVDLDDPHGARRGLFALQLHSGGPTEVRFRNIRLKILGASD